MIAINGGERKEFDFDSAFLKWESAKERRLLHASN